MLSHAFTLTEEPVQTTQAGLSLPFFFFFSYLIGEDYSGNGGQNAYEVSLSCAEMILLP